MTTAERKQWLSETGWRAICATHTLIQAKRQRVSDYEERIRELKKFVETIRNHQTDLQQLEMFEPDGLLDKHHRKLIETPLAGLE
jgi:phosphopantetheine adenylyltransferase